MQVIITINPLPPGSGLGPNFTLTADVGVVVPNIAALPELLAGKLVTIDPNATVIYITSMGVCTNVIELPVPTTTTSTSTTSTSTSTTSTSTSTTTSTTSTTSTTTSSTTTTTTISPVMCFGFELEIVGGSTTVYYELPSSGNIPPISGKPAYDFSGLLGYPASIYFDGGKWVYFNSSFGGVIQTLNTSSSYPISDGVNPPIWTPDCNGCSISGFINTSVFGSCPTTTTTTTLFPCYCFTLSSSDETFFNYIDCNGIEQTIGVSILIGSVDVCSLIEPIADNPFGFATFNGFCTVVGEDYECLTTTTSTSTTTTSTTTVEPTTSTTTTSSSTTTTTTSGEEPITTTTTTELQPICECYSLFNENETTELYSYTACNGNVLVDQLIVGLATVNICAQIGSVSANPGVTIALSGNPCIDNIDCNPF